MRRDCGRAFEIEEETKEDSNKVREEAEEKAQEASDASGNSGNRDKV